MTRSTESSDRRLDGSVPPDGCDSAEEQEVFPEPRRGGKGLLLILAGAFVLFLLLDLAILAWFLRE